MMTRFGDKGWLPMAHYVTKHIQAYYKSLFQGHLVPIDDVTTIVVQKVPRLTSHASMNSLQEKITAARREKYPNEDKHLFVDVDGVLNTLACRCRGQDLDIHSIETLRALQQENDCKVHILSAGWSNSPRTSSILHAFGLGRFEIVKYDAGTGSKSISLCNYLMAHPEIHRFLILEDEPSEFFNFARHVYHVNGHVGLFYRQKKEILEQLDSLFDKIK
jgi:hypothetical protein